MRSFIDPKRHYKGPKVGKAPKYFHVGYITGSGTDLNSSGPKRSKRRRLIDELLADAQRRQYFKKKYVELTKVGPAADELGMRQKLGWMGSILTADFFHLVFFLAPLRLFQSRYGPRHRLSKKRGGPGGQKPGAKGSKFGKGAKAGKASSMKSFNRPKRFEKT